MVGTISTSSHYFQFGADVCSLLTGMGNFELIGSSHILIQIMKYFIASMAAAFALSLPAQAADVSTKITDTHVCCPSCVKAVDKVVKDIPGVTAKADQDDESISLIAAPDTADRAKKAMDALVARRDSTARAALIPTSRLFLLRVQRAKKCRLSSGKSKDECISAAANAHVKSVNTALESVLR